MPDATWEQLTAELDQDDLAKLTVFRDFCRSLHDVEERVHTSEIAFARRRVFASAYVKSHYLELGVALAREVADPAPRTSFPVSKLLTMHRYSLREPEAFDDRIRSLIAEAADTVGPGRRRSS